MSTWKLSIHETIINEINDINFLTEGIRENSVKKYIQIWDERDVSHIVIELQLVLKEEMLRYVFLAGP